jgi:hypothetical protein
MFIRIILLSTLISICAGTAMAQNPGPEFWRKVGCQPLEPRTKLELLEETYSALVIKGFTRIETTDVKKVDVEAVEMRYLGKASNPRGITAAKGIAVILMDQQNRAWVDYDEIDPLLNAIDRLSRVDETTTKLANFEGHYRTEGDLEITVFRQTRSGTAVRINIGICNPSTVYWTLDDLAKLRAMIKEAKTRLDELG